MSKNCASLGDLEGYHYYHRSYTTERYRMAFCEVDVIPVDMTAKSSRSGDLNWRSGRMLYTNTENTIHVALGSHLVYVYNLMRRFPCLKSPSLFGNARRCPFNVLIFLAMNLSSSFNVSASFLSFSRSSSFPLKFLLPRPLCTQ